MTTVAALFKDIDAAQAATAELVAIGIAENDISIISHQSARLEAILDPVENTAAAAGIGAVGGGAIGLIAGVVTTPVAGIGLISVIGWLSATLGGIAAGLVTGSTISGVIDILRRSGASSQDAHFFTEGLRAGGTLVAVRTDKTSEVGEALRRMGGGFALQPEDIAAG